MYEQLKDLTLPEQVEQLTLSLVKTLSINGTKGEVEVADQIIDILLTFPYFKSNPDFVYSQELPNDVLGRKNIFARIKGKGPSKKTVIFHSHLDTVGIDDYGKLQSMANEPDELLSFFQSWEANPEIKQQALSGEWMFGRGALDMKSGIAVHLANVLFFSQHIEAWDGEILFMVNPVEENQHSGVIAAVEELLRLRETENLDFIAAINNDYISALYPGDTKKYIYTGAVGKLLPCFYVYGRETHVGQTLDGLDPTLVTSELNRLINNNMELTEHVEGELMTPPSALYHRDTKDFYNVQTALTSHLYFNFMILESSPKEVMEKLKEVANRASSTITEYYQQQYKEFSKRHNFSGNMPTWEMDVYTYEEYRKKLQNQGVDVQSITESIVIEQKDEEPREICFQIVDRLRKQDKESKPCIILFYAPPYCPHNYLQGNSAREREVLTTITNLADKWATQTEESLEIKRFFPYLSDSSYLSLHDTDEEIDSLIENFPEWKSIYPVPVEKIRQLNIPAINVGVYGFDAHRWTERVYKPYSFHTVPLLIRDITKEWLEIQD